MLTKNKGDGANSVDISVHLICSSKKQNWGFGL